MNDPVTEMQWTVDLGGGMVSPDGDDAAAHDRMVQSWRAAGAEKTIAWVNAYGGEARYAPMQTGFRWPEFEFTPRIAVRTASGWVYAAPSDTIVMGDGWFDVPWTKASKSGAIHLREFTIRKADQ